MAMCPRLRAANLALATGDDDVGLVRLLTFCSLVTTAASRRTTV
jgi:hypothetical protein